MHMIYLWRQKILFSLATVQNA
uniref:Uncharacterized protein n=1 Tax=Arundo donax TaxID=35708 RepID=A0A0A9G2C7_ARUDO